jgi:hypothetical protein
MGCTARLELSIAIHILDLLQAEVGSLVSEEEVSQEEGRTIVGFDFLFVIIVDAPEYLLGTVSLHVCIYSYLSTISTASPMLRLCLELHRH